MSPEITFTEPGSTKLSNVPEVGKEADLIQVTDQPSYEQAAAFLRSLKPIEQEIQSTFQGPIAKAHEAHKGVIAARDKHLNKIKGAILNVRGKMSTWKTEQERKRMAEERRLREEAKKKADDEQLRRAEKAEAEGKTEEAEKILTQPTVPVPAAPIPQASKTAGVSARKIWKAEVVDWPAFLKAMHEKILDCHLVKVDTSFMSLYARNMSKEIAINGVRVYFEMSTSTR